jgi:hypothetical protein
VLLPVTVAMDQERLALALQLDLTLELAGALAGCRKALLHAADLGSHRT